MIIYWSWPCFFFAWWAGGRSGVQTELQGSGHVHDNCLISYVKFDGITVIFYNVKNFQMYQSPWLGED